MIGPSEVGDESLWQTNPVWCIDRMMKLWSQDDRIWVHRSELLQGVVRVLDRKRIWLPPEARGRWLVEGLHGAELLEEDYPCPGVVGLLIDHACKECWVTPLKVEPSKTGAWSVDSSLPFRPATVLQDMLARLVTSLHLP